MQIVEVRSLAGRSAVRAANSALTGKVSQHLHNIPAEFGGKDQNSMATLPTHLGNPTCVQTNLLAYICQ